MIVVSLICYIRRERTINMKKNNTDNETNILEKTEATVNRILKLIDEFGKLSDSKKYEYTNEQVEMCFNAIQKSIERAQKEFGRVYISKMDINSVEGPFHLSFKGNSNMKSILQKVKLIGFKTIQLQTDLLAVFMENSVILYSGKEIMLARNATEMFECTRFTSIDMRGVNTSNTICMKRMFANTFAEKIDLSGFNTANVYDMSQMFCGCQVQTLDLSSFDTSNVTNMRYMFDECQAKSLDLKNFDTSNVTNMEGMFSGCQVQTLDLSSFDTSNVTNMESMFRNCHAKTLDLSNFDVSNLYIYNMFEKCVAAKNGNLVINESFIKALANG